MMCFTLLFFINSNFSWNQFLKNPELWNSSFQYINFTKNLSDMNNVFFDFDNICAHFVVKIGMLVFSRKLFKFCSPFFSSFMETHKNCCYHKALVDKTKDIPEKRDNNFDEICPLKLLDLHCVKNWRIFLSLRFYVKLIVIQIVSFNVIWTIIEGSGLSV